MTDRLDPRLAAIERRLQRASQPTAPPGLRQRVLAAVDDALHEKEKKKVPATKSGWSGEGAVLFSRDVVAGTFFMAAAAVVLWLIVALAPLPFAPLTLEERARIAGVSDEAIDAFVADSHAADPAPRATRVGDVRAHQGMLRVFDRHRLLEEIL